MSEAPKDSPSDSWSNRPVAGRQETRRSKQKISAVISSFSKKFASDRSSYIEKRMVENIEKSLDDAKNLYKLSTDRRNFNIIGDDRGIDLLSKRQKDAVDMHHNIATNSEDTESSCSHEDGYAPSAVLLGANITVKNAVLPINLPEVKRLPPYTSWIFLDRNQKMPEDQSVVGRKRIYYDQNGEALICSDSEEEAIDDEDSKRVFGESEDYILRMTIEEVGLSDTTLDVLARYLCRNSSEIKGRFEELVKSGEAICHVTHGPVAGFVNPHIDQDLDAALDSFDSLFCRRCFVFDCKLHGCSQDLVFPSEKQSSWSCSDVEKNPCGPDCHRLVLNAEMNNKFSYEQADFDGKDSPASTVTASDMHKMKRSNSCQNESSSSEIKAVNDVTSSLQGPAAAKCGSDKRSSKRVADNVLVAKQKRQKKTAASDSDPLAGGRVSLVNLGNSHQEEEDISTSLKLKYESPGKPRRKECPVLESEKSLPGVAAARASNESVSNLPTTSSDALKKEEFTDENKYPQELVDNKGWKPFEKALYEKGIQIFGRNSCLIARNLMSGLKSCSEVFGYMHRAEIKLFSQSGDELDLPGSCSKVGRDETVGGAAQRRSKNLRRKGRVRRPKYTWKSAGYQSFRKRISERKDQPCTQYNPCGCQSLCGKECPCLVNGTCCEKYCGCPKSCKNRFRGCHCAKSQCRSRQCPCFAANRECDPDVCRNCWISCGDGNLGVPSQRGDNYECRNMKLLLKQQQRVLLGRSGVSGWGAFLKNSVGKHEYLGEYTGEVISHHEADKRGKIYDLQNSSFLFNLNDQFVLDAYRKGDKLKFANHSSRPNCYAKVIMVGGDHRVGIFAKERISAGEELFYDYRYKPDSAPAWAKKPVASGAKREDAAPSSGRAKKHA